MTYEYLFNSVAGGRAIMPFTDTIGSTKWFNTLVELFTKCDCNNPIEYCNNDAFGILLGTAATDYIVLDCILKAVNANLNAEEKKAILNTFDKTLYDKYGVVRSDVKDGTSQN
jgi:hypothetical protein